MGGVRDENFFSMQFSEAKSVFEQLLPSAGVSTSGEMDEVEGEHLGRRTLRVIDPVHEDEVHLFIFQPWVDRGFMGNASIKTGHPLMLKRCKNGGHAAAGDHGSSEGALLQKVGAVAVEITHGGQETWLGEVFNLAILQQGLQVLCRALRIEDSDVALIEGVVNVMGPPRSATDECAAKMGGTNGLPNDFGRKACGIKAGSDSPCGGTSDGDRAHAKFVEPREKTRVCGITQKRSSERNGDARAQREDCG